VSTSRRLEIRLFSGLEASLGGRPLQGFESDKVRGRLAYLAVEQGYWHRREQLAALLWPDKPADVALNRLRQALMNLRTVLGDRDAVVPLLAVSRSDVRLAPDGDLWLNLAVFNCLLAECERHHHRLAASATPPVMPRWVGPVSANALLACGDIARMWGDWARGSPFVVSWMNPGPWPGPRAGWPTCIGTTGIDHYHVAALATGVGSFPAPPLI
jgi:hypothetical protein